MIQVGAFEAKNTLGSLLDEVERGGEVLITRHGKAVARLVPDRAGTDRQSARDAANRIRRRSSEIVCKVHWSDLKKDRDKGRP